jgi:hypothetical protein
MLVVALTTDVLVAWCGETVSSSFVSEVLVQLMVAVSWIFVGLKVTLIDLGYMNINGWDIESKNGVFCIHCVLFNSSEHAFVIDPINDKDKFGWLKWLSVPRISIRGKQTMVEHSIFFQWEQLFGDHQRFDL